MFCLFFASSLCSDDDDDDSDDDVKPQKNVGKGPKKVSFHVLLIQEEHAGNIFSVTGEQPFWPLPVRFRLITQMWPDPIHPGI